MKQIHTYIHTYTQPFIFSFIQISQYSDVANSFTKLIRACAPSGTSILSSHHPKYLSLVEESEWLNQISSLIQLSAAIADLLDAQGSSVLVCLEEGFDATAQVCVCVSVSVCLCLSVCSSVRLSVSSYDV